MSEEGGRAEAEGEVETRVEFGYNEVEGFARR